MHLLLIESNPATARQLHSEFLDYRGVNWSMSHCTDHRAAIELLEQDSFQSVLLSDDCPYEQTLLTIQELLQTANCPPLIAVTGDLSTQQQLNLVEDGIDDCFNRAEINGAGIMRHVRMAELRNSISTDRTAELVDGSFSGYSLETLINDPQQDVPGLIDASHRTLQIAHVSNRSSFLDPVETERIEHTVHRFEGIRELANALDENIHQFDALLVEQSVFETAQETDVARLRKYLAVVPGVVLTMEKSDFSALSYLEFGYSDCLIADNISSIHLFGSIQKAVARRRRELLKLLSTNQVGLNINDRRSDPRDASNRRRHVRFDINSSIVAIPILPNGAPDLSGACDAMATSVSLGGMGITIPHHGHLPRRNWILGVQQPNGITGYASAFLRQVTYADGEIRGGLVFQNKTGDFFRPENLWPKMNLIDGRLSTRISGKHLDQWVELGVLTKRLARRTHTCPECEAVSTVGTGCQQCGDFDLKFEELVHHFACAFVDKSSAFEHEDSIQCPKCLCDNLVAGADFEVFRAHYECQCCNYQGDVTAEVGCCLNCQLRFPAEMAPEVEVYGYDVERLDVLAFVDVARHTASADPAPANI